MTTVIGRRYRTQLYNELDATARAEGRLEGRVQGAARAVLALLDKRGVAVSEEVRKRILGCEDAVLVDLWFDRAFTAVCAEDVVRTD